MNLFEINTDILLLVILTTITVIGYMIAINAKGATRMSFSYLLATLLLAVNILVILQYVGGKTNASMEQEYLNRLAKEKEQMQQRLVEQGNAREELREQELRNDEVLKVQAVVAPAIELAEQLATMNMQDYTLTIDQKIAKASSMKRKVQSFETKYKVLKADLVYVKSDAFSQAMEKLLKSAMYCKLYYTAEDSDQESVRENVMRTNAVAAKRILNELNNQLERMKS